MRDANGEAMIGFTSSASPLPASIGMLNRLLMVAPPMREAALPVYVTASKAKGGVNDAPTARSVLTRCVLPDPGGPRTSCSWPGPCCPLAM